MSEEQLEEQIEDQTEAPDEGLSDSQGDESAEVRARRMGWKPQEEYKGKDQWVDAETFVKKTEEEVPQLRDALRTMERNYQKLEKSTEAILQHQERQLEEERKRAYNQAVNDVEARLARAVEDGDSEGIKKAINARDAIKEQQFKAAPKTEHRGEHPVVSEWKAKNSWFNTDPVLKAAAAQWTDLNANLSLEEQLAGAEKYVKETFPHKFRQAKEAPAMPGGGNNVARNTKPKPGSYEALTNEAKAECDRCIRDSNGKISKEDWLKYASPEMFRS